MSWFDPDKRVLAEMEAAAAPDGAGFSDDLLVELTKGQPEDSEPDGGGA